MENEQARRILKDILDNPEETPQRRLPFVWELDYDGVVSYAIGVNHRVPADFTEDAERYVSKAQHVLFESADLTPEMICEFNSAKAAEYIDRLTAEEQRKFEELFALPIKEAREESLLTLFSIVLLKSYSSDDSSKLTSVDDTILGAAKKRNISTSPLETTEENITLMSTLLRGFGDGLSKIIRTADPGFNNHIATEKKVTEAYLRGDEEGLRKAEEPTGSTMEEYCIKNPEINEKRNIIMVERSMPYLAKPSIVAVGVAHYVCESSMLTVYKEKGIKNKRVQ